MKKFYLNEKDGQFAGVCQGIAEYFDWDPSIVRIVFLVGAFSFPFFGLLYCAIAIAGEEKPDEDVLPK